VSGTPFPIWNIDIKTGSATMAKKKSKPKNRKKRGNKAKSKQNKSGNQGPGKSLAENTNLVRFSIFLVIGVLLLALFYYYVYTHGGFGTIQEELATGG
jgi:hypothetical protein